MLNNQYQWLSVKPDIPVLRLISLISFSVTGIKGNPLHLMRFIASHYRVGYKKDARYV
jgi:hypothetical protein